MADMNPSRETSKTPPAWTQFSLVIPVRRPPKQFRAHIASLHQYLSQAELGAFEIILVPNSAPGDSEDDGAAACLELASHMTGVRVVAGQGAAGKGAALRTGIRAARGRWVGFTDADLPYAPDFFARAAPFLQDGHALVVGNRRSPQSWFEVPVPLLRFTYGRHRMSLLFNRLVRWLLPIRVIDTQAGIKAMTREFAQAAFTADLCPGFFFDLELFLVAEARGAGVADLPVHFTQHEEATTVRFIQQSLNGLYWLARIKARHLRGHYRRGAKLLQSSPVEAAPQIHLAGPRQGASPAGPLAPGGAAASVDSG
ncbi:MAG: glycosyltransferase family 2 protein [SAR324 cluster bacterium]